MTERINRLTEHKVHKRTTFTSWSFENVGARRGLLNYLMKKDIERYREIISSLSLESSVRRFPPFATNKIKNNPVPVGHGQQVQQEDAVGFLFPDLLS